MQKAIHGGSNDHLPHDWGSKGGAEKTLTLKSPSQGGGGVRLEKKGGGIKKKGTSGESRVSLPCPKISPKKGFGIGPLIKQRRGKTGPVCPSCYAEGGLGKTLECKWGWGGEKYERKLAE